MKQKYQDIEAKNRCKKLEKTRNKKFKINKNLSNNSDTCLKSVVEVSRKWKKKLN